MIRGPHAASEEKLAVQFGDTDYSLDREGPGV